jgi:hypothetical protein
MPVLHGSRLCGGVKYEVAGPLICLNTRGGRRPSNDRVLPLDQDHQIGRGPADLTDRASLAKATACSPD